MKKIEELAAEKYISEQNLPERKRTPAENYIDWAVFGAKEAQRWISVKESMPEDHKELLLDKKGKLGEITIPVLVKYKNGRVKIDSRYNFSGDNYNFWFIPHTDIIEWRPIERKY